MSNAELEASLLVAYVLLFSCIAGLWLYFDIKIETLKSNQARIDALQTALDQEITEHDLLKGIIAMTEDV